MGEPIQVVEGCEAEPGLWIVTTVSGSVYRVTVAEDGSATMVRGRNEAPVDPERGLPGIALHGDGEQLNLVSWSARLGRDAGAVFVYWSDERRIRVQRTGDIYAGTVRKTSMVVGIEHVPAVEGGAL
ncbi:hypothetical protein [Leucobacter chromiireducens]|uniref:Uncharacterized protein n=1 Tax=Leucobacter chromiireducens subsp. solipictus TaxID=398235 RepID=A0ABS1SG40_9MICO|nr:hypothetical protein [Leucobacter chromiireducens]MBL3679526.1 hypothetical protein [Leucobacter chromiireducens subsp. solipictus]